MKRLRGLCRDARGAIFVEQLIAYLPIMFFFLATWQLLELFAAHLIVERAASAAARAAVVVLPDDPAFYDDIEKDSFTGKRKEDIELAAALILAASPHFSDDFTVALEPVKAHAPLTVTVTARFHCFAGWVSLVCGGESRMLTGKSTYVNQGAAYDYKI